MFTHSKFTQTDLIKADTVLVAGQYNKIGEYKVLAGEVISPGYGIYDSMENAVGRIYGILKVAADTEIVGTYQLAVHSPQDIQLAPLGTWRTEDWNTVVADKTKQIPFARMPLQITKDKKLVLFFMPDASATIDHTKSKLSMDITRQLI